MTSINNQYNYRSIFKEFFSKKVGIPSIVFVAAVPMMRHELYMASFCWLPHTVRETATVTDFQ